MFKELLNNAESMKFLANFSLIFFFAAFILIVVLVLLLKKDFTDYMSALPLENDNNIENK